MSDTELKQCPFCGGKVKLDEDGFYMFCCDDCGAGDKNFFCLKYQRTEYAKKIRKQYEAGEIKEQRCNMREWTTRKDGLCNTLTTVQKDNYILEVTHDESDI